MIHKNTLNLGISFGIVSVVLFLLQVVIEGGLFMSFALGLLALVCMIALPIMFVRRERNARGGYMKFGEVFTMAFFGLLIGGVISTAFSLLYIGLIDPEYPETVIVQALEAQQRFMEGNLPQEQMEEIMRSTEAQTRESFTPFGMLKSFFYYALFYVVLGLIFAAFLKKNPPADSQEILDSTTA